MNPETDELTRRYGRIITGLFQAISAHNHVLSAWLFPVINTLYRRTHMRVVKLLEKLRAGTYRQPRPRTTPRRAGGPAAPVHLALADPAAAAGELTGRQRRRRRTRTVAARA